MRRLRPAPDGKPANRRVHSAGEYEQGNTGPRLIGAGLCASASLLLLLSSFCLFARDGHGRGAALLLLVGLGLLLAAMKSFGRH